MSSFRHKVQARASGGKTPYSAAASNIEKEAEEKGAKSGGKRKSGGKVQLRAFGGAARGRMDKRAAGGGIGCNEKPFSTAAKSQGDTKRTTDTEDHHQPRKAGGKTVAKRHGGEVDEKKSGGATSGLAGASAAMRKHGGKTEHDKEDDDDGDDDEDEEEESGGYARGGSAPEHIDLYMTKGGTHYWKDNENDKASGGRARAKQFLKGGKT